jgi:hypothetical protein
MTNRSPLQTTIEHLLGIYRDPGAMRLLNRVASMQHLTAMQACYQKDYLIEFALDPAVPALQRAGGTIVTDQGYDFFATEIFTSWPEDLAGDAFPLIAIRQDNGPGIAWQGTPTTQPERGAVSARIYGPATAGPVARGANLYRVFNEPRAFTWWAGDRSYLDVRAIAGAAPCTLSVIVSGIQIDRKALERF